MSKPSNSFRDFQRAILVSLICQPTYGISFMDVLGPGVDKRLNLGQSAWRKWCILHSLGRSLCVSSSVSYSHPLSLLNVQVPLPGATTDTTIMKLILSGAEWRDRVNPGSPCHHSATDNTWGLEPPLPLDSQQFDIINYFLCLSQGKPSVSITCSQKPSWT